MVVRFHPILLGAVVVGTGIVLFAIFCLLLTQMTGNEPPWTLPAKAKYLEFDRKRASRYFGVPLPEVPSFFPIRSILVSQEFDSPGYA